MKIFTIFFILISSSIAGFASDVFFVHTADTLSNTFFNYTVLDNEELNGNPNAIVIATQNWNPNLGPGVYNDNEIGVWYTGANWSVYNEDFNVEMPHGAGFNIIVPQGGQNAYVHMTDSLNSVQNVTYLDHPYLNNNPDARVNFTHNWSPNGGNHIYNDHPTAVWYDGTRWSIYNEDLEEMQEGLAFNILIDTKQTSILHTVTNILTNNWETEIDHPDLNGNADAVLIVNHNWNPPGLPSVYNNHHFGTWFNGQRWRIFNQDFMEMPANASFNITYSTERKPQSDFEAVHYTHNSDTLTNTFSNFTLFNDNAINGNRDALVFVTQNWNPPSQSGVYNDQSIGVWYNGFNWSVYNEDFTVDMPHEASFNVIVPKAGQNVFLHVADSTNLNQGYYTYLDHPLLNNRPDAAISITHNWSPNGGQNIYNDHPIAVFYHVGPERWAIYNMTFEGMTAGMAFNVMVHTSGDYFIHTASPNNITSNWTDIDNELTNNNPNAIVTATQNWNPKDSVGVNNPHNIGVWYNSSSGKWAIFNQDLTAMTPSASFNVEVFTDVATAIAKGEDLKLKGYELQQNFPNPFNPSTTIRYTLPISGDVSLKIYNLLGQEVAALINKSQTAGGYEVKWDGIDAFGNTVASGLYFYRLKVGDFLQTKRMILTK